MRTLFALAVLVLAFSISHADEPKAAFPVAPVGFDDGRAELERSLSERREFAATFICRAFEDASLRELAAFAAAHLEPADLTALEKSLKLEGKLVTLKSADEIRQTLDDAKIQPKDVIAALGHMLEARGFAHSESAAWLYARDFNCRALRGALDRGSNAARALAGRIGEKSLKEEIFEAACWQFDGRDCSRSEGGHYDMAQIIQAMMDLNMSWPVWAAALGLASEKHLDAETRKALSWGDAALVLPLFEGVSSERDVFEAARQGVKSGSFQVKTDGGTPEIKRDAVLAQALRRLSLGRRWLRTAGPGVIGVYQGPLSTARVKEGARGLGAKSDRDFAAGLSEAIADHFKQTFELFTLVAYEDGSARAFISGQTENYEYGPDAPLGRGKHWTTLFEGRLSLKGREGLLRAVFAGVNKFKFAEVVLENVEVTPNGAFMLVQATTGKLNSESLLLRRISRNCALE